MNLFRASLRTSLKTSFRERPKIFETFQKKANQQLQESEGIKKLEEIKHMNSKILYSLDERAVNKLIRKLALKEVVTITPLLGYTVYFLNYLPLQWYTLFGFYGALLVGRFASKIIKDKMENPLEMLAISKDESKYIMLPLYRRKTPTELKSFDNSDFGINQLGLGVFETNRVEFTLSHPEKKQSSKGIKQNENIIYVKIQYPHGIKYFELDLSNNGENENNEYIRSLIGKNVLPEKNNEEELLASKEKLVRKLRETKGFLNNNN